MSISSTNSINTTLKINIISTIILTTFAVGCFWIVTDLFHYRETISVMKENLTEMRKKELESQVDKATTFINFENSITPNNPIPISR